MYMSSFTLPEIVDQLKEDVSGSAENCPSKALKYNLYIRF